MIHSFAFFRTLYGNFLKPDGEYRPHNEVLTKTKMVIDGEEKKVKALSSPLVKEWSQVFFNNQNKIGAILDY